MELGHNTYLRWCLNEKNVIYECRKSGCWVGQPLSWKHGVFIRYVCDVMLFCSHLFRWYKWRFSKSSLKKRKLKEARLARIGQGLYAMNITCQRCESVLLVFIQVIKMDIPIWKAVRIKENWRKWGWWELVMDCNWRMLLVSSLPVCSWCEAVLSIFTVNENKKTMEISPWRTNAWVLIYDAKYAFQCKWKVYFFFQFLLNFHLSYVDI